MEFKPISSYGLIGNLRSCALVNMDGGIDWCCLPCLDSPSVFAAILDPDKGGTFRIAPEGEIRDITQEYVKSTNILKTVFVTGEGTLELTDWMHMGAFTHRETDEHRLPAIFRRVRCTEGAVKTVARFDPRLDYARAETHLEYTDHGVRGRSAGDSVCVHADCDWQTETGKGALATRTFHEGEEDTFVCHYGSCGGLEIPAVEESLEQTERYWNRWISECQEGECPYIGPWHNEAVRSLLAVKILAGGHGIAAAATTSLPEVLGGSDNWDYRFSWIRDTSFTIQSLTQMGHFRDAEEFLEWICDLLCEQGRRPSELRILYPLHTMDGKGEEELTHLRGYRDSAPVRIGNAAAEQNQWDIYGEVLEAVYRSEKLHPDMDANLSTVLVDLVDYVCEIWREPDQGIWELRDEPKHYVYSKVMCWVALDRGIKLAQEHGWKADVARWKEERDAIHREVMERGYCEERGCFRQSFGSDKIDATALLFPLLEFIDPQHPYALSTLETIQRELSTDGLVYRSEDHHGKEGAFVFCSFWLVDALVLAGRYEEAERCFKHLLSCSNHLGLYSEEIDPKSGEFLGNFPQAFTHVGLINSAVYLGRSRTEEESEQPIMGEKHMPTA